MDKLRDFQEEEVSVLLPKKRAGIAWDMGLGKTAGVTTIGGRAKLRRWLVVCPDNAFSVWGGNKHSRGDFERWLKAAWPEAQVMVRFVDKSPAEREEEWRRTYQLGANDVLIHICTPDTFLRDWATRITVPGKKKKVIQFSPKKGYQIPNIVVLDEAKRLRSPSSQYFQVMSRFLRYYNVEWLFPMTGTPGHAPRHFWTMLHMIDPKYFSSYWKLVYAFHDVFDGPFGKVIGTPKNLDHWHRILRQRFSVIKEDDEGIADQRPAITRQLLPIQMDPDQEEMYNDLQDELMHYVEQDDNLITVPNEFVLATRLRQCLICPRILSPGKGVGGAIKDFVEVIEPEEHNVIFTPYTGAFPHFEKFLTARECQVYALSGGIGAEVREERIRNWRRTGGVVICSVMYAQAFSLEPATKAFFIGYDWDPDNNRQAEKRLHRLTTVNPITVYYYTFESTFDYRLCEILNIKQEHVNLTIPSNLRRYLLHATPGI